MHGNPFTGQDDYSLLEYCLLAVPSVLKNFGPTDGWEACYQKISQTACLHKDIRGCFFKRVFARLECLTGLYDDERVLRRCRGFAMLRDFDDLNYRTQKIEPEKSSGEDRVTLRGTKSTTESMIVNVCRERHNAKMLDATKNDPVS